MKILEIYHRSLQRCLHLRRELFASILLRTTSATTSLFRFFFLYFSLSLCDCSLLLFTYLAHILAYLKYLELNHGKYIKKINHSINIICIMDYFSSQTFFPLRSIIRICFQYPSLLKNPVIQTCPILLHILRDLVFARNEPLFCHSID